MFAVLQNRRLNQHLAYTILDEVRVFHSVICHYSTAPCDIFSWSRRYFLRRLLEDYLQDVYCCRLIITFVIRNMYKPWGTIMKPLSITYEVDGPTG